MTLLIALIANAMFEHMTGTEWCSPFWITVLWIAHVLYHSETSKK